MRAIEFTITTIATIVLALVSLTLVIIVFNSQFSKTSEPMEELTTESDDLPSGIDTTIILGRFNICPKNAKYKCFQPPPFDNEWCGSSSTYNSMGDCVNPCATASAKMGGDDGNTYSDTGQCYCRCVNG
ncbi:MAG: hypothetical protein ABH829_03960 [archaeon]